MSVSMDSAARLAHAEAVIALLVRELRTHRYCGDQYPENGWPGVNEALAQYEAYKRAIPSIQCTADTTRAPHGT